MVRRRGGSPPRAAPARLLDRLPAPAPQPAGSAGSSRQPGGSATRRHAPYEALQRRSPRLLGRPLASSVSSALLMARKRGVDARASAAVPAPTSGAGGSPTAGVREGRTSGPEDEVGSVRPARLRRRHAVADVAAGPRQAGLPVEADRGVPVAGRRRAGRPTDG